jgi:hypothetical protein
MKQTEQKELIDYAVRKINMSKLKDVYETQQEYSPRWLDHVFRGLKK